MVGATLKLSALFARIMVENVLKIKEIRKTSE